MRRGFVKLIAIADYLTTVIDPCGGRGVACSSAIKVGIARTIDVTRKTELTCRSNGIPRDRADIVDAPRPRFTNVRIRIIYRRVSGAAEQETPIPAVCIGKVPTICPLSLIPQGDVFVPPGTSMLSFSTVPSPQKIIPSTSRNPLNRAPILAAPRLKRLCSSHHRLKYLDECRHPWATYVGMRHVVNKRDGGGNKPLSEPVLYILMSLAEMPRHGYALIKDIEAVSGGRVRLSTGTLFGAIRRLLENGWIQHFQQEDTARDKQAYRLTAAGRKQLQLELDRLKQLTRTVHARLRTRKTET